LLTGRRIGEVLALEHSWLDYKHNLFTLPREITKTQATLQYQLTPLLLEAIKIQKTTNGKVFDMSYPTIHYHFKKAINSIGVYNMVIHDLRSMVGVTALRNGADIYSVSKMLSHKLLSTTQKHYLNNDTTVAIEAQNSFTDAIIDTELVDGNIDEFMALKRIYPDASDEKIYKIIEMMK